MRINLLVIAPCCSLSFKLSLGQHVPKLTVVHGQRGEPLLGSELIYLVSQVNTVEGWKPGTSYIIYIDVLSMLQSKNLIRHCVYC